MSPNFFVEPNSKTSLYTNLFDLHTLEYSGSIRLIREILNLLPMDECELRGRLGFPPGALRSGSWLSNILKWMTNANIITNPLSRIRARQPQILRRALEIQQEYGDPIQNLVELLMPGSQEDWEALMEEPYD